MQAMSIINAVQCVTKKWAKQRKAEERAASAEVRRWQAMVGSDRESLKEIVFRHIEDAYEAVSDDGNLPAHARQIMYDVRRRIQDKTDEQLKSRAIKALQADWYAQFADAYAEWFKAQCASGRGYISETDQWMLRLDDDPAHDEPASIKIEFQRQCLFWRDGRDASKPLRIALRELHPEFCRMIQSWRQRMTPTELSDVLTHAEGSLVVDSAMAELERAGITAISTHDGVAVRASRAEEAREILLRVSEWHLGFRPRVSLKGMTETLTAAF
ncbi:MAG: hypothetical protein R3C53_26180 [Pirellulaceae bacterium]